MRHELYPIEANGESANIYTYLLDNARELDMAQRRPLVVICPGGGYGATADREAEPIAIQMNAFGFHAVVLRYSVKPATFPTAVLQLAKTVALVRAHAEEWKVLPEKVFVMGFSAGGHLAASLGVFWNKGWIERHIPYEQGAFRPNGLVLCYPVITAGPHAHRDSISTVLAGKEELWDELSLENQVDKGTPPSFIWHTLEDTGVKVENSFLFAEQLRKHNVAFELHVFQYGDHGLALATAESGKRRAPNVAKWVGMAGDWMQALNGPAKSEW